MTNQTAEAHFSVNATTVKLPTFWTRRAAFWFRRAEIRFALHGITGDATEFYHVFRLHRPECDTSTPRHLMDIIAKPPEGPNKRLFLFSPPPPIKVGLMTSSKGCGGLLGDAVSGGEDPIGIDEDAAAPMADEAPLGVQQL